MYHITTAKTLWPFNSVCQQHGCHFHAGLYMYIYIYELLIDEHLWTFRKLEAGDSVPLAQLGHSLRSASPDGCQQHPSKPAVLSLSQRAGGWLPHQSKDGLLPYNTHMMNEKPCMSNLCDTMSKVLDTAGMYKELVQKCQRSNVVSEDQLKQWNFQWPFDDIMVVVTASCLDFCHAQHRCWLF